jgi:ribosomal subunit interface protein
MDVPLEIAFRNMDKSPRLEDKVRTRVERLQRLFNRINSCHVVVEAPHRSEAGAVNFHVRVEVRVPEKELVVSRDPGRAEDHSDVYLAIRDAFAAMERQLEQHSQKIRRDVKAHPAPLQGRVLRMFADYGFIATNDGREIYFHKNAVVDARFEDLEEGATVKLSIASDESPIGPQATTVRPIGPMTYNPEPPPTAA